MTLCQELGHMQNKVLTKVDYVHAEHALIQAFGNDWNKSLTLDKDSYLGSGCVAQVLYITHSLILNYLLTHSLTHSLLLTHSLTLTYLLTHLLTYSLTHLLTHSLTHSLTYSLTYLLTHLIRRC